MSSHSSHSAAVLELAEEFIERHRAGERPPLREYVERYPDLADEIREVFPAVAVMENVAVCDESLASDREDIDEGQGILGLEQLGDYRIIREAGRGGMGIVYEAEQVSLRRHVALKVLPRQLLLDPKQKVRFEREAKAAAKLHHTNIVPVFGVGEQDDLMYYVMQYIRGLGLNDVLEELKKMQSDKSSQSVLDRVAEEEDSAKPPQIVGNSRHQVSAAVVAESLMSGEFTKTFVAENPGACPEVDQLQLQRGNEKTAAYLRDEPSSSSVSEAASIPDPSTETGNPSDTFSQSDSFVMPGQSDASSHATTKSKKQNYWQSVAHIGRQVAGALQYAHDQGVLHRDIKPSNLLMDTLGTVWITDFGLAKADDQQDITHIGDILGTLRYMAPEMFEGQSDARSEVYAIGLTLYELLCLKPAFDARDRRQLIKQVTTGTPPPLAKCNSKIPLDLVTIVQKAIAREAENRYQSAGELASDLARFIDDEPINARRISVAECVARWSRQNKALAISLSALVLLLLTVAIGAGLSAEYFRSLADANAKLVVEKDAALQRESSHLRQTETTLYYSKQNEASALRLTRKPGYRKEVFSLLKQAMAIDTPAKNMKRLRQEAVACLGDFIAEDPEIWPRLNNVSNMMAVFPDSQRVAFLEETPENAANGSGLEISIRTIPANREIAAFQIGLVNQIDGLAVTRDGKLIVCDRFGFLEVWEQGESGRWQAANDRDFPALSDSKEQVNLHVFPDGLRFVVCRDRGKKIMIQGLTDPKLDQSISVPARALLRHLAISPDEQLLAVPIGSDGGCHIEIWNVATGELERRISTALNSIHETAFTPDGLSLVCSAPDRFCIYDVKTCQRSQLVKASWAKSISFTPDSQLMAYSTYSRKIRILNLKSQREIAMIDEADRLFSDVVRITPNGQWLLATRPSELRLWRLRGLPEKLTLAGHKKMVPCIAFSPDGSLLTTGSKDGTVRLWNAHTGKLLDTIAPGYIPQSIAFSTDGRLMAVGSWAGSKAEYDVTLWDVESRRRVAGQKVSGRLALRLAFTSDGQQLVVCGKGLSVFDVVGYPSETETGDQIELKLRDYIPGQRSLSLAISPNDDVVAFADRDQLLRVWDLKSRQEIDVFSQKRLLLQGWSNVSFLPKTQQVVFIARKGKPQIWDAKTGEMVAEIFDSPKFQSCEHALSPDGHWFAGAWTTEYLTIINLETRKTLFSLREDGSPIKCLSWSPNGQRVAVGFLDGRVSIWNLVEIQKRLAAVGLSWI